MIYADLDFYQTEYCRGRTQIIPSPEFSFWAEAASDKINWRNIELSEEQIIKPLKRATCEIAEILFVGEEKKFMALMPSQSVDGYGRGAVSNLTQEKEDLDAQIRSVVVKRLNNTILHNSLVFRGA